jgi:hypothetical protein
MEARSLLLEGWHQDSGILYQISFSSFLVSTTHIIGMDWKTAELALSASGSNDIWVSRIVNGQIRVQHWSSVWYRKLCRTQIHLYSELTLSSLRSNRQIKWPHWSTLQKQRNIFILTVKNAGLSLIVSFAKSFKVGGRTLQRWCLGLIYHKVKYQAINFLKHLNCSWIQLGTVLWPRV